MMQVLTPKALKEWREARLKANPHCDLCGQPLLAKDAHADHDHTTGLIRGVVHRACNGVLGKVDKGTRFGGQFDKIAFAAGLHRYLTKPQEPLFYPTRAKLAEVRKQKLKDKQIAAKVSIIPKVRTRNKSPGGSV